MVVRSDEQYMQDWARRGCNNDATHEELRDATLFDFNQTDDLLMFMSLIQTALRFCTNMCLNGEQYIAKNFVP